MACKPCLLLAFLLSACGFYSFTGALPADIKTIYIEDIRAKRQFYNVDQNLTIAVTNAFIEDNTLQIVNDRNTADLIVKGTVDIQLQPLTIDEGATQSKEDKLSLFFNVDCQRKASGKSFWKKRWERYELVSSQATQQDYEEALLLIIAQIAEDTVLNTVAVW
jgi:hypothetical protein